MLGATSTIFHTAISVDMKQLLDHCWNKETRMAKKRPNKVKGAKIRSRIADPGASSDFADSTRAAVAGEAMLTLEVLL